MSFSRLLLAAASSKKYIVGENKNDKVRVSHKDIPNARYPRDPYEGEVVLCFQIDKDNDEGERVASKLGLQGSRCDGIIFYSQDEESEKVICLVEMKSSNPGNADEQIIQTKSHIKDLLTRECQALPQGCREDCENQINSIKWKACLFHHGSSPSNIQAVLRNLMRSGFDVRDFTGADNDVRRLLTGEESAREMAKKYKPGRQRHGRR